MDVRHGGGESALITNLIVHRGFANIFDQTTKFIRIPDVVEKTFNLPLIHQWFEFLENVFQFPGIPCLLGSALDFENVDILFQFLSPLLLLNVTLRNGCAERSRKGLDLGCQRLYHLLICLCSLEYL